MDWCHAREAHSFNRIESPIKQRGGERIPRPGILLGHILCWHVAVCLLFPQLERIESPRRIKDMWSWSKMSTELIFLSLSIVHVINGPITHAYIDYFLPAIWEIRGQGISKQVQMALLKLCIQITKLYSLKKQVQTLQR